MDADRAQLPDRAPLLDHAPGGKRLDGRVDLQVEPTVVLAVAAQGIGNEWVRAWMGGTRAAGWGVLSLSVIWIVKRASRSPV